MSGCWLLLAEGANGSATMSTVADRAWRLLATPLAWAVVTAAVGVWLLLPRGSARGRRLGMIVALVSLGLFGWLAPRVGNWLDESLFLLLAATTVISALATVTARNPVYSAIWFAVVLLGSAGLLMIEGAQFLGIATVVVYAGAILVTFLFVLMLAQPEGHAYYDRISWDAPLSGIAAVLAGLFVGTITKAMPANDAAAVLRQASIPAGAREAGVLAEKHVAALGARMFSEHLVAVEVAGVLLLAALVGAVAIVQQGKKMPPAGTSPSDETGGWSHG